jgi:hypothetical protein
VAVGSAGWAWRDVTERRQTTRGEVASALEDVERLHGEGKWPEAEAALRRAEGFLRAGHADEGQRRQVQRWQKDLALVARLEEIRLVKEAGVAFAFEGADGAYDAAFNGYGLNLKNTAHNKGLPLDVAAQRIRDSAIKAQLVAALQDWAWDNLRTSRPGWERLIEVARQAEPDEWRDRLLEAFQRRDRKALVAMASDKRVADLPPGTALLLSLALDQVKERALATQVCLRVQQRHPGDLWLNGRIAALLGQGPRKDEAIGYWRAFLAAHPYNAAAHTAFAFRMH